MKTGKKYKKLMKIEKIGELNPNGEHIDHDLYELGKCKLISEGMKNHLIEYGMLDLVINHIHLYENNK